MVIQTVVLGFFFFFFLMKINEMSLSFFNKNRVCCNSKIRTLKKVVCVY